MLSPRLIERLEPEASSPRPDGDYVIYWMRVAARAIENPALDVALCAGRALNKPVFIYQRLEERSPFASDRLHTFILEGAREAQRSCAQRGVGYAFHLERASETEGRRESSLNQLARRAALVVTDFMPVEPLLSWDEALAELVPVWRVDASCLAPVWSLEGALLDFAEFLRRVRPLWTRGLKEPWPDVAPSSPAWLPALPFEPVELQRASLPSLIASCDIDHTVAPVHHTPGGASAALGRWTKLRHELLAAGRTEPTSSLVGASGLGSYFHFGHLSCFQVAREIASHSLCTELGATFIEKLFGWRELASHFCLHHPHHETLEALPRWARQTLRMHERDARPALPSAEQLARGQTGDLLWDAAQRQLLIHGELDSKLRPSWGKALLGWTRTAQEALSTLLELSHRYALDGASPSSHLGALWCLGAFDAPFSPEAPVVGQVRPRPPAERLPGFNLSEFQMRASRPSRGSPLTVAIIGAGVAGAAAARALTDAGQVVTLFDAGAAPGGRLATHHEGPLRFDAGAQFFIVKDERFARWARGWWQERVIKEWRGRIEAEGPRTHPHELVRLVGAPAMDSLLRRMLLGLDVRSGVEIRGLTRDGTRWRLLDSRSHAQGEFELVVVATPAAQAAALVDPSSYALASLIRQEVVMSPCWTAMVHFPEALDLDWDARFSAVGPLRWLGRNSSKPERPTIGGESWVCHASAAWSHAHRVEEPAAVAPMLMDAFFATTGARKLEPSFLKAHLWPWALTTQALGQPCLWDEGMRLAVCGDWCLGSTVEAAFLSGSAAAGRINALGSTEVEDVEPPARPAAQLKLGEW